MLSCTDDTPATHIYTLSLHDALPIYDQLVEEGKLSPADLSRSTFYRYLANQPLLKSSGGETGEETKRFAYKFINELWQADVMHGPRIKDGRRKRETYLICFLDDASRWVFRLDRKSVV